VRVGDRDRGDPAELLDARAELVVEERDAVPEDVAARARRLDEERALADREARLAADPDETRRLLANLGAVVSPERLERRPPLTVAADVLPLVLADRAARRRLGALGELAPAGGADEMRKIRRLRGARGASLRGAGSALARPAESRGSLQ